MENTAAPIVANIVIASTAAQGVPTRLEDAQAVLAVCRRFGIAVAEGATGRR